MGETLERRLERLELLYEVGIALSAEDDKDRLVERILLVAKDLCNADGGTLYLRSEDNELPHELRANLISIGLWLLREAEEVRQGRSDNFEGLIEVSQIIRDGIQ